MEELLFNKWKYVNPDYISDFKYRVSSLKVKSNPELKKRVLTKQLKPEFFISCKI